MLQNFFCLQIPVALLVASMAQCYQIFYVQSPARVLCNGHNVVHLSAGGRQSTVVAVFTQGILVPISLRQLSPLAVIIALALGPLGLDVLLAFIAWHLSCHSTTVAYSSHVFSKIVKKCRCVLGYFADVY